MARRVAHHYGHPLRVSPATPSLDPSAALSWVLCCPTHARPRGLPPSDDGSIHPTRQVT